MEYQVPQFIEVEDKIIGPLTLKQFIYVGGGVGLVAMCLLLLPPFLGILLSIPIGLFAAALAFYTHNGKPFIDILEAGFLYLLGGRLYLWKKEQQKVMPEEVAQAAGPVTVAPQQGLTRRKLEQLAWSLDVKDGSAPQ